jgi:iron complex transport system permease protein
MERGALSGVRGSRSMRAIGLAASVAVLVVACLLSLAIGTKSMPLSEVVRAFTDFDGSNDHLIVRQLRLPRTLVGLLVGAALAVSGAMMQAITRNPLAEPGLLGVNSGAALAVVLSIYLFDITSLSVWVWFAFGGAAVAAVVVFLLGSIGRGGATPIRLALAGAALTALLSALTQAVLLLDQQALDQYRFWEVGSLAGRDESTMFDVLPFIAVGLALSVGVARSLNAMALGDETARALGTRIVTTRVITAIAITLLCGASTAACGPIGFVGLVVPLGVRSITGPDQRWLIPYAAVLGPVVILGCDIVGRVVNRPSEVQVGIMTAVLGGPAFVWLVRRVRMAQL